MAAKNTTVDGLMLVYGLGESGLAASRALSARRVPHLVADAADSEPLRASAAGVEVTVVLGATPRILLDHDITRIVASPGVPPRDPVLSAATTAGIPVLSEVALGLELLPDDLPVVAVTGTNGKTTVIDMLHIILEESGIAHAVAGNSWRALTGCLEEVVLAGALVLEVSSFQLHYLSRDGAGRGFAAAALLNVRPDHMNWHTSYEEYEADKLRIFEGQGAQDLALLSAADPVGGALAQSGKVSGRAVVVGGETTGVRDGWLHLEGEPVASVGELSFVGVHNYENALFAAAAARRLGASLDGVRRGLARYRLKPHRLSLVAERAGVRYVDDSKATNPAAVAAALESFDEPVVLLLGGSEKETGFDEVLAGLRRCRAVVCFGEAGPRISEYLRRWWRPERVFEALDLEEAVEVSERVSEVADVVLLSPGCASFDAFVGYAERGDRFAELVTRGGVRR